LPKAEVRRLACEAGLETHAKKDSTGICFIGEQRFREFLARYLPARPGTIRTPEGEVLGAHAGVAYYTLGQREGLKIGGVKGRAEGAWFVAAKDVGRNELVVVQGHDHPLLQSTRLEAESPTWVSGAAPVAPFRCAAKTRYRQPDQACTLTALGPEGLSVEFDGPQRAVTPGQSVVFYAGEECLGGAVISAAA